MTRVLNRYSTGQFARLWGRFKHADSKALYKAAKELLSSLMKDSKDHDVSFDTALDLLSFNDAKRFPVGGSPLPFPFPLSFIFYSLMVRLQGNLPLTLSGQYQKAAKDALNLDFDKLDAKSIAEKRNKNNDLIEKGQEFGALTLGLGSDKNPVKASLEVLFELQAAWTVAAETARDEKNGIHHEVGDNNNNNNYNALNNMLWGPLIQDIFDYVEMSITVGPKLELENNIQWQLAYLFGDEDNPTPKFESQFINRLNDLGGQIRLSCPISARLSVFAWQTDVMSAQLAIRYR